MDIINILEQHQEEKALLRTQGFVTREKREEALKLLSNDLIKVITGPRRAGKSVFSVSLLEAFDNNSVVYINFDDEKLVKIKDYDEITEGIQRICRKPAYLVFDEVQNLSDWELFVQKLHRRGYKLIITGSNANLLSKELATSLTGRYLLIELLPFSFREFLQAKKVPLQDSSKQTPTTLGIMRGYLDEYLTKGGFPEVVTKDLDVESYLGTLFEAVLFKDIVRRYRIRKPVELYDLALNLVSQFSREISFTKLKNLLNLSSVTTLQKYTAYFIEAYLFFSLRRFSFKHKEQIKAPQKNYLIDTGMASAKAFRFSAETGRYMENCVGIELLRRGYIPNKTLFYYKTRNQKEIDFVCREGIKVTQLIQVTAEWNENKKRELSALCEAAEELNCHNLLVLTKDETGVENYKQKQISYQPLLQWFGVAHR